MDDVLYFPKINRIPDAVKSGRGSDDKRSDEYALDMATVVRGTIREPWDCMGQDGGRYGYYNYLDESELYDQMLSEIFTSLYAICNDLFGRSKEIQSKLNSGVAYEKVAYRIHEQRKALSKIRSYLKEIKTYLDFDIETVKGNGYCGDAVYVSLREKLESSLNYITFYEDRISDHLSLIETYSNIEADKNNHNLGQVMEMFAVITVLGLVPSLIFSFYGMNIEDGSLSGVRFAPVAALMLSAVALLVLIFIMYGWLVPIRIHDDSGTLYVRLCRLVREHKKTFIAIFLIAAFFIIWAVAASVYGIRLV